MNIDDSELNAAKARVWRRLESRMPDRGLSLYQEQLRTLKSSGELMEPSRLLAVQSKERFLDALPDRPVFLWMPFFKRAASFSLLSFMGLSLLFPAFKPAEVLAFNSSTLEPVSGTVTLNGEPVHESISVLPGDRVALGDASKAHLLFRDGSRVTLGEDTIALLREAQSETVIVLNRGLLWAQTLDSSMPAPHLFVETHEGRLALYPQSSLSVEVDEHGTFLAVLENVARANLNDAEQLTLGPGAQVALSSQGGTRISKISDNVDNAWWDFNRSFGYEHEAEFLASRDSSSTQIRVLPGDLLYPIKTFSEDLRIGLSFDAASRNQLLMESAGNRLMEAQALLDQGRPDDAEVAMSRYQELALQLNDSLKGGDRVALEDVKDLVLSDSDDAIQLASAKERPQLRLQNASKRITSLPELLNQGDLDGARSSLQDYADASKAAFVDIEAVPLAERLPLVRDLLQQKIQDWEILKVSESLPQAEGVVDARAQMVSDMNLMALSLQEESLDDLTGLLTANADPELQELLLAQLQTHSSLPDSMLQQMEVVQDEMNEPPHYSSAPVLEIDEPIAHTDEPEQDTDRGE